MTNATTAKTIRPEEAAHFGALAGDWWDPKGSSAMLHRLNPVRLGFLRAAIDSHWLGDSRGVKPLTGKRALDVGCGAGLLCEPLARLGAAVTGVDAAAENIAAASAHAVGSGLLSPLVFRGGAVIDENPHPNPSPEEEGHFGAVQYACGDIGELGLTGFDLVTSMEVIEHVADKPAFITALAAALAPGGQAPGGQATGGQARGALMVLSTPNRTAQSRLLLVDGAERFGMIPRGTHHWDDFVTPDELRELLGDAGLAMGAPQGIAWSPGKGLHLSDNLALNYIVTAVRL